MEKKNKGWGYLNSEDLSSMSDGSKGDWGYTDSDGNGSFQGGDGSWGYKNADGEGSYVGSDGSWGYKNSDGSGSFFDADGSWGYRDADGGVSYFGADGSWGYNNPDGSGSFCGGTSSGDNGNDASGDNGLGAAIGTIIGTGLVGVAAIGAKAAAEERKRIALQEAEQREQARIKIENRRSRKKQHRKGVACAVFVFLITAFSLIGYYEVKKLTPIGYSSESLEGLKYTEVIKKLEDAGFSHVRTKNMPDLSISKENEENLVTAVKLILSDSFDEDTKYPANMWITVEFHTLKLCSPPLSSKEAKGMNYIEVIGEFKNAGFVNVSTIVEYDIVTGWLTDDGEVKSVSINGGEKFDLNDKFRLDAEVVITYHSFHK